MVDCKMDNNFHFNYCGKSITFHLPTPEDHIQKQIINSKNFYELDLLEELGRFPLKDGIICDIGANIGNHTIYFSSILKKDVYAFEPNKIARNILDKNIELNDLKDKIKVFQVALGSNNEQGVMNINESNLGASSVSIVPNGDISIRKLDDFISDEVKVSVLKIDVEGFEVDVLEGAKKTIETHKPLLVIETQTHFDFLNISKKLYNIEYVPYGEKGKTSTVVFIHKEFIEEYKLSTYLIRKDIEIIRGRIQGQNDKLSKKILTLIEKIDSQNNSEELNKIIEKIDSQNNSEELNKIIEKINSQNNSEELKIKTTIEKELNYQKIILNELNLFNEKLLLKLERINSSKIWRYGTLIKKLFNPFKHIENFQEYRNRYFQKLDYNNLNSKFIESQYKIKLVSSSIKVETKTIAQKETILQDRFQTLKSKTISNNIFVGIAAIPSRKKALERTIASLISQTDRIGVYLNGWDEIPDYLKHNKIDIIRSQDCGDIGDAGKFYWVDNHEGFYFTCDDDIVYPRDYVRRIISKIKEYKFKAVIGWHGSVIIEPFVNYYKPTSRRVFAFGSNRPDDTYVHILGTGTVGFHSATINVKLKDFIKPNMADVFFAELGQNQKVPFVVMKHPAKEMISIENVQEDSINKHGINNINSKKNTKEFQNQLVRTINWKLFNTNKLKVLMVGRFDTFTKGGIYKSNHLIKNTLEELGHEVIYFDSQIEEIKLDKNIDAAIIYPGDPNRPDFSHAEKKMHLIREKGIPVCINMSYNTSSSRSQEIVKKMKKYNENSSLSSVFLMTFSDVALSDLSLSEIKDFIIPMPKTIVSDIKEEGSYPLFDEREGIVLGDASKLMNNDITGGNIIPWIVACKKLLPHVKLYVFKQYGGEFNISGVETVPYMKEGFLEWTAQRRIFVCLNSITTFEMTPTEAQIVGTPVIYRPMPQSLSEYVGRSGISVTSPDEFAQMCAWLYNDKYAWDSYSNLALKNSQTNKLENLSIGLESSIRKIIFKNLILKNKVS